MIDTKLQGKVALITGANNPLGIGAATARALAKQGAAVFLHYFRIFPPESLDDLEAKPASPGLPRYYVMQKETCNQLLNEIQGDRGEAATWEADLADPTTIPDLMDRAESALGPIDILVNNAAAYQADTFIPIVGDPSNEPPRWEGGPRITTITAQTHDLHFAVNSRAVALLTAEFARRRIARDRSWGRIVNISGDASAGAPEEVSYWASKHALEAYSRAAAAELGPHGITVNVVLPGPVQSGYINNELEQRLVANIPLRRIGRPEDIADAVVFLASEQARWITGQLLHVHGGHRLEMKI